MFSYPGVSGCEEQFKQGHFLYDYLFQWARVVPWRMVQGLPYQEVQKQWTVQWGNVSMKVWSLHFC